MGRAAAILLALLMAVTAAWLVVLAARSPDETTAEHEAEVATPPEPGQQLEARREARPAEATLSGSPAATRRPVDEDGATAGEPQPSATPTTIPPDWAPTSRVVGLLADLFTEKLEADGEALAMSDATGWTRRELPDATWTRLASIWSKEGGVPWTADAAREAWMQQHERDAWLTAGYGSGSFIVRPPPAAARGEAAVPAAEHGQPATRDKWWRGADVRTRVEWLTAYFVETSGLFELGERTYETCWACRGTGVEEATDEEGRSAPRRCTRCRGARVDVVCAFR